MPLGWSKVFDDMVELWLLTKLDCPITSEALMPLVNGGTNFNTLLFSRSLIQRLPEESKTIPVGQAMLCALTVAPLALVKLGWPRTSEADIPFVNGAEYSSVLLLIRSVTQRLPEESKVIPEGVCNPVWLIADAEAVKPDWPMTKAALCEFVKADAIGTNELRRNARTTMTAVRETAAGVCTDAFSPHHVLLSDS